MTLTSQTESLVQRTGNLIKDEGWDEENVCCLKCDVLGSNDIRNAINVVEEKHGKLDFVFHSVAFAPKEALESVTSCSREDFSKTLETSVFSLIEVAKESRQLLKENGGSILTLSFVGASKTIPSYGLMGPAKAALESSMKYLAADLGKDRIRLNAISPGPVNTVSARSIPQFTTMRKSFQDSTPLSVTDEEMKQDVGNLASFLVSDQAKSITGQIIFVDGGYHIL